MRTGIKDTIKSEVGGIALIALGGLVIASLSTGTAVWDNQPVGAVGSFLARISLGLTGDGRFILSALIILIGLRAIFLPGTGFFSGRVFGCLIVFLEILLYKHLPFSDGNAISILREGVGGAGGGVLGALLSLIFVKSFGTLGTQSIMYACGAVAFILITGFSFQDIAKALWNWLRNFSKQTLKELGKFLYTEEEYQKNEQDTMPQQHSPIILNSNTENINFDQEIELPVKEESGKKRKRKSDVSKELNDILPEMNNKQDDTKPLEIDRNLSKPFILPSLGLLKQNLRLKNSRMNKDLSDKVRLLEETLRSFGVNAKVNQVSYGPTITRFELQPAPGVKVSKIQSLADDIALNLAASQVRIEAPIPGKSAVGIEVPNKEISQVMFREVLETEIFQNATSKLTVALGKDIAGNPVIADLSKMPHLLIAGATGSGKSVCLNSLICSLLFKASPAELKLMMIDPKMVELTTFNGIPHLISPVVTDAKKAATALKWMVNEMEHRYELFAGAGVRNIESYNKLKSKENSEESSSYLSYVAVIIDELADLMLVSPADVEDAICRLAQMARAAGIHLVVATQRPSVDVITGLIKANIPSRIAFAVSSQTDSRVILDSSGAEKLLGKGDMLFLPIGAAKPIRVQGVFVSDSEVEKTVEFWKEQGKPEYEEGITKLEENQTEIEDEDDPLLPEAVRVFLESGQASISLLQRRLHVGYTRAARLVDQMEQKNIVGGFEGSKPRSLLIGWDDFQQMFNKM